MPKDPADFPPRTEVLVIEDDEGVRTFLGIALKEFAFGVTLEPSGEKAVEFYRTHHAIIDVVLLDVQISGMDGPATLAALKEINPGVRCCFMSGYTGAYTVEDLLGMGALMVLQKPFDSLSSLAQSLRDIANGR
jgi:DNA-binding NtrC family response regulator